jgi:uncharacterized protein YjcR
MMSNEDFERKMAFIVNQQAQFAVDIEKLREAQAKTEEAMTHLAGAQAKTEEVLTRLAYVTNEGFKDVNAKIDALVNSHVALQDSHKLTEESLRQLSATVDRYFKNRHNGG